MTRPLLRFLASFLTHEYGRTWRSLALVLVTVSVLLNVAHAGFDTWLIQTLVRAADRPVFVNPPLDSHDILCRVVK
jgi:hypothetical protein